MLSDFSGRDRKLAMIIYVVILVIIFTLAALVSV